MQEESRKDMHRILRRIIYLAGTGFYKSMELEDMHIRGYFLKIMKEAVKLLNNSTGERDVSGKEQGGAG